MPQLKGNQKPRLAGMLPMALACAAASPLSLVAQATQGAAEGKPPFRLITIEQPPSMLKLKPIILPQHAGKYQPFRLTWKRDETLTNVSAVYPHPVVPQQAVVATGTGLLRTSDGGRTWQELPEASVQKIGRGSGLAYQPDNAEQFYVASATSGLWMTRDGGKSFKQVGTKARGLLSDSLHGVCIMENDRALRTVIVLYGDSAAGISRSTTEGESWETHCADRHIYHLAPISPGTPAFVASASLPASSDVRSVYFAASIGEYWQELITDTLLTDTTAALAQNGAICLATADKGLFKVAHNGGLVKNIGPSPDESGNWASMGAFFGPTADQSYVYAYDPSAAGFAVFTPEELDPKVEPGEQAAPSAFTAYNKGLFVGPLVQEGAHVRHNASGTVFYGVVNKALYRGATESLITEVRCEPPVILVRERPAEDALDQVAADLRGLTEARSAVAVAPQVLSQMKEHLKPLD